MTHIRRDSENREDYWISLCGVEKPQSSYSRYHVVVKIIGEGLSHVPLCEDCMSKLRGQLEIEIISKMIIGQSLN